MSWGVLGEIEFEVLSHPMAQSERVSADYAEHARLQGKPVLQWVGDGLDELTLELALHVAVGDPEARVRQLKAAKAAHEPLPYVLGSGDFRGIYLITSLEVTSRKTDYAGRLFAAQLNLTLREFTGKYTKPLPVPLGLRNSQQANTNALALPLEQVVSGAKPLVTAAQQALGYARTAGSLVRSGLDAFQLVRDMQGSPAAMLNRLPGLLGNARQMLEPLGSLQGVAALLDDGADLVQLGADAASDIGQAISALDGAGEASVVNQVGYATTCIEQAMARMDSSAPRLAGLASDLITRRA
ncbi:phage tail protein [Metapseudomonas otitidis]|uniref:phage tail protein n=1 Tax=Metapseudomonas otitidis TaxID=319939 RepID=UPI001F27C734|nr:phage tail protein [Pseudomonas otitidis]